MDRDSRHPWLRVPDMIALAAFASIAVTVTAVALVESYTNLYEFFVAHGLRGWRASIAPGCVDAFIVMGELLLFAAFVRSWKLREGAWIGWLMAAAGFAVSVAGNVEHDDWASLADKLTAAVFPVTAAAGLAGGLVIIKRVTSGHLEAGKTPAGAVSEAAARPPRSDPAPRQPAPRRTLASRKPASRKLAPRGQVRDLIKDLPPERVAELASMSKRDLAAELGVTTWAAETWQRKHRANGSHEGVPAGG